MPTGKPKSARDAAQSRAQAVFAASEQREQTVRQMIESERVATDVKTAKLRALRMAKEEEDRIAAANAPPPVKPAKKAAKKPKRIKA